MFLRIKSVLESRSEYFSDLDSRLDSLALKNSKVVNELITFTQDSSLAGRYNSDLYKDILENTLSRDVCSTYRKYASAYFSDQEDITGSYASSDCSTTYNGIWSNGYIIGIKAIFQRIQDIRVLFSDPDLPTFKLALK